MPEKILIVDDEKDMGMLIKQKFRKQIKDGLFDFVLAYNGNEALQQLEENPDISIILSDINMPEMDGLTLLTKLKELKNSALRTIIVSAYGDMENIRTAMNRGAFDFLTKPVDFGDLEKTIEKTIEDITVLKNAADEHNKLIKIEKELSVARQIQLAILPKSFPEGGETNFKLFAVMEAAKEVGGDLYDFFKIDDENWGIVIGDVSGKGVPAAIFMAVSRTLIRATGIKGLSPADCMEYVNSLLCNESIASMFVTVFYAVLNTKTGELTYTNAGHNTPYIINSNGTIRKLELPEGLVLGIIEGMKFSDKKTMLNENETLFLYTDGVTEAFDKEGNLFSDEKLENLLESFASENVESMCNKIVESVHSFSEGVPQTDDITVLSFKFTKNE